MAKQQEKFVLRPRDYLLVHNTTDHVVKTSEGAVGQRYNLRFFVNPGEAILIRGKHFAHTGLDRAWDRGEVHVHRLDLHAMETVLSQHVTNHGAAPTLKHAQVVHMLNRERCIISTHPLLQPVLDELCITIGQDLIVIDEDAFNEQYAEGGTSEAPAENSQGPETAGSTEAAGAKATGPDHGDSAGTGTGTAADVPAGSSEETGRGGETEGSEDPDGSPEVQGGSDAPDASGADAGSAGTGDGSSEESDLGDSSKDAEREEVETVDDGRSRSSDSSAGGSEAEGAAGGESGAGETTGEADSGSDSESGRVADGETVEAEDDGGAGEGDSDDDGGAEPEPEPEVKEKPKAATKKKKAGRAKKKRN